MSAIYKRELKSYFRSFIGFLFIAVTLFFLGLYFSVYNLMNGYPYFAYVVSSVTFLFMLTVPILTMRILAEEKRSKTDQLILTAPVSVGGIVMGKFLALLTIFAIPVAIICFYPLIMAQYGSVPMGEAYLSILAYFLFGMTAIAIGLFLSSVTESQVIAAVLTFLVLFLGYMMDSICSIISSTGNLLTKLLRCFDLYTPFSNLLNGTLDVSSIVYYASVTALVLFLTVQSIQKRRYSMSVKNLSFSAYSTGMIAVAVALVVVVNIIMGEMPSSWTAIDMTSQKLYSLTDQTVDYVKNMQDDVTIYVLVNQDNQDTTLGQTLQRYDDLSDHITVEYVDPTVNPMFYTQYTTGNISTNSLIVVSDKRSKVIDYNDVYESSYDFDYSTYSYNTTTTGYDGEGQITSALDYVLNDDMPKVYMTTGHNELSLSNTFTSALNKENVDYETVNLMDLDAIPDDAACLFINGATSDFSSDDKDKVIEYVDKIDVSAQHLLGIINDVLDMSKIEAGKTVFSYSDFSILEFMQEIQTMFCPQTEEKHQSLVIHHENIVHEWVNSDYVHLMQIFSNLLSNAVKYTQKGGKIQFLVEECETKSSAYAKYHFAVIDNGVGMSEDFKDKIFDTFTREESSLTNKIQGTGLGMAITKNLIEAMGGTIDVDSELGLGSCFEVFMDLKIAEESVSSALQVEESETYDDIMKGMRFLCAEDNELNAEILTELLKIKGAECTVCENGERILETFERSAPGDYDMILMDVQMPVMNGYGATKAIRKSSHEQAKTIPIIAMTANAFSDDIHHSLTVGMNAHISKPVEMKVLEKTISSIKFGGGVEAQITEQ